MTTDHDFKQLVRARMDATGQTYTAARAALVAERAEEFERARAEQERIVGRFIRDGRLVTVPGKRKARAAVLLELVTRFAPARVYTEKQVNEILGAVHEDFAFWRRELVDYGYLARDEGRYRLVDAAPIRPVTLSQEIPAWERLWLPSYLTGGTPTQTPSDTL